MGSHQLCVGESTGRAGIGCLRLALLASAGQPVPVWRFDQAMPALFYSIFLQVKSDEHMAKVKEQLLFEKQQIEAAEQR